MLIIQPHSSLSHEPSGLTFRNDTGALVRFGRISINGQIVHDTPLATADGNPNERVQALDLALVQPEESPIKTLQFIRAPKGDSEHA